MKNLKKALEGKKLEDLVSTAKKVEVKLLDPTKEEVEQVLALLKEGKGYKEIKATVRRVKMAGEEQKSSLGLSYGQIKEIDLARRAKIAELTPVVEDGEQL